MFRGYDLRLGADDVPLKHYARGRRLHANIKARVDKSLAAFRMPDGSIDASRIAANWFPSIRSDVFISHAHEDSVEAIALAGWLDENFGLRSFVDSCAWGYAGELIRLLDEEWRQRSKMRPGTFDYQLRNRSTSHVHMMVAVALSRMINRSELVLFLDTPNSLTAERVIGARRKARTVSPWIYTELAMTSLVEKKMKRKTAAQTDLIDEENLFLHHEIDVSHLTPLSWGDMERWRHAHDGRQLPLDVLYAIT